MGPFFKNKKLNSILFAFFMGLVCLSSFQNCGRTLFQAQMKAYEKKQSELKVAGTESNVYKSIQFDATETFGTGANQSFGTLRLNIDLTKNEVIYSSFTQKPANTGSLPSSKESCTLDSSRHEKLVNILNDSTICQPVQQEISCQAFGIADIILYTASSKVELTPVICNHGTFLCDDRDSQFRAVLIDIKNKKPTGGNCHTL